MILPGEEREAFIREHWPSRPITEIAAALELTRQRVWQIVRSLGLSTHRPKGVERNCALVSCRAAIRVPQSRARKSEKSFCNAEHYYAWRFNPQFLGWRQGMRLGRAEVAKHFKLEPRHIVHHLDGNERNNEISNLIVFASASDHMRHHHRRSVEPIWRGATVAPVTA